MLASADTDRRTRTDPLGCRDAIAGGYFIHQRDSTSYPVPEKLNLILATVSFTVCFALLWAACHLASFPAKIALAVAFAFLMQLGFGLAHEAAHSKLHMKPGINEAVGIALYSLFPGSYHLFEIAHLVHHRRNRSDAELEDYILPTETAWLKRTTYYLVLCGMFWVLTPVACVGLALIPGRTIRMRAPADDAGTSSRYVQFLNSVNPARIRRDLAFTVLIWTVASLILHLNLPDLALCYAAFAFCWASQQYIYHVHTPRHVVLGARDLRLWRPFEFLYLHFNYHLTHHVAAWVPWIYLPKIAAAPPTDGFLTAYWEQWRPPQKLDCAWPSQFQTSGPLPPHPGTGPRAWRTP